MKKKTYAETMKRYAGNHGVVVAEGDLERYTDVLNFARSRDYRGWMLQDSTKQVILWGETKESVIKTAIAYDPSQTFPFFVPCVECEFFRPNSPERCGFQQSDLAPCYTEEGFWDMMNPFSPNWGIESTITKENAVTEYLRAAEIALESTAVVVNLSDEKDLLSWLECYDDYPPNKKDETSGS